LIHFGFRWTPKINLHDPGVVQVLSLMGPRVLTVFFIQLIFIAQDNLASRVGEGSVTALVYGWLFMQVPETLIGTALGTALLPTLSEQIVRTETAQFKQTMNKVIRIILALTIPGAVLLSIVIEPAVALLNFDAAGTQMVVWTSRAFMIGLVGQSLLEVAARAFYARQDARTPLITSSITLIVFIILGVLLFRPLGTPGIALANSLAFSTEAVILLVLLNRRYEGVLEVRSSLLRIGLATLAGALAATLVLALAPISSSILVQLVAGSVALGAGILVILPWIWRQELKSLVKL
jgi:putative peptidoglycan lipid II flippase